VCPICHLSTLQHPPFSLDHYSVTLLPGPITTTESGLVVVEKRLGAPPPNWWRYAILELWVRQGQPSDYAKSKRFMQESVGLLDRCYGGVNRAGAKTVEGFGTTCDDFGQRFVGPFRDYGRAQLEAVLEAWIEEECYPIDRKRESIAGYMTRCIAARRNSGGGSSSLIAVEQEVFFAAMRANPELASQLPVSVAPVSKRLSRLADEAESDMLKKISSRQRRGEARVQASGTERGAHSVLRP